MEYHNLYGPAVPEMGWVPAPSYLLRRHRVLQMLETIAPCDVLEIGCGAGTLLHEMERKGFSCTAFETSIDARKIAEHVHRNSGTVVTGQTCETTWQSRFDLVMALEVLEHIEADDAALQQWHGWLKPGGMLLLSVPAHMKQWTASDEWAGHYRRYERAALERMLLARGFEIEHIEPYGSPLGNLIDPMRARVHARQLALRRAQGSGGIAANSSRSGVERTVEMKLYPYLCSFPGRAFMQTSFMLQKIFARLGIGKGYLVKARKYRE